MAEMLTMDDARAQMLAALQAIRETETLALMQADGRYLAQDLCADIDVPGFDNSAMDGFALAGEGLQFQLMQRIAAGETGTALQAGEAARIFTGAPVPQGTHAVVMQEFCRLEGSILHLESMARAGQHIRKRGEDIASGSCILRKGTRLHPAALALLASLGIAQVNVYRRPRVALLTTGSELTPPGQPLAAGKIYDSNRYALNALLRRAGCECVDLGIINDNLAATVAALENAAAQTDLILSTGGVSVGEEDHVKAAMQKLGVLSLWKLAIKPGKPLAFGRVRDTAMIGLPGSPVSAFVTYCLFVVPYLRHLSGGDYCDQFMDLPAAFDWNKPDLQRREFLRVQLREGALQLYPNQGSAVMSSLSFADGLVRLEAGQAVTRGDVLRFMPMAQWM